MLILLSVLQTVGSIAIGIAASTIFAVLLWLKDHLGQQRVVVCCRWLFSTVTNRSYVLVWLDDEASGTSHAATLISSLQNAAVAQSATRLSFANVGRPTGLLFYPLTPRRTRAVILLDTDVTKLADQLAVATRIETNLRKYVEKGGRLVGSHDLIYRRVRATVLQGVLGYTTNDFLDAKNNSVAYKVAAQHSEHFLRTGLADEFVLTDNEVCWGDAPPSAGAEVIFYTGAEIEEQYRPLVVTRQHGQGRTVWLNSGDRGKALCASIATPEDGLVRLLRNAIDWVW